MFFHLRTETNAVLDPEAPKAIEIDYEWWCCTLDIPGHDMYYAYFGY